MCTTIRLLDVIFLFATNTLSPTLNLNSLENFGKFTEKEVSFFATLRKSLSQAALLNYLSQPHGPLEQLDWSDIQTDLTRGLVLKVVF